MTGNGSAASAGGIFDMSRSSEVWKGRVSLQPFAFDNAERSYKSPEGLGLTAPFCDTIYGVIQWANQQDGSHGLTFKKSWQPIENPSLSTQKSI